MKYSKDYWKEHYNKVETFFFTCPFRDERIKALLMDMILLDHGTHQLKRYERDDVRKYGNCFKNLEFSQLSWSRLCGIANKTKKLQYSFCLLYVLLEQDDWTDPYREYLMPMKPVFKKAFEIRRDKDKNLPVRHPAADQDLFCYGEIASTICYIGPKDHLSCITLNVKNEYLIQVLQDFFNKKQATTIRTFRTIEGKHHLISRLFTEFVQDFNERTDIPESTFWKQVDFIRKTYNEDSSHLSYLFKFYAFLMEGPMPHLFKDTEIVSLPFLKGESTIRHLRNGYHFANLSLSAYDSIKDKEKVVFILKGYDRKYNTVQPYDFKAMDCSGLADKRYIPLFWKYALNETINGNVHFNCYDYMVVDALNVITEMKNQPDYECPDPLMITRAECIAIKASVLQRFTSKTKRYQTIAQSKRFLSYCEETGLLKFQNLALRRLQNEWQPDMENINETVSADMLTENHGSGGRCMPRRMVYKIHNEDKSRKDT